MSARSRTLGIVAAVAGALLAVLPTLPWYGADLPGGGAWLSGYASGGESWILPVIGGALVVTGVLVAWWRPTPGTRLARVLGAITCVMAALGIAWAALIALSPRVRVIAERPGEPAAPIAGDWDVTVLPPAWIVVAAAAIAGMAGILLITPSPDDIGDDDPRADL